MPEPRFIVDRVHELCNARRYEDLGEVLDEDVLMVIEGASLRGLAAVRDYLAGLAREVPTRVETERILAESDDLLVSLTRIADIPGGRSEHAAHGMTLLVTHRVAAGRVVESRSHLIAEDGLSEPDSATLARINQLIGEQSALRRVATLVARGVDQTEVLDAIVGETAALFESETWLVRYDSDGSAFFLSSAGAPSAPEPRRFVPTGDGTFAEILRSKKPARVDDYASLVGPGPDLARQQGVVATAAVPLIVQGSVWGALALVTRDAPLSIGIENRLAQFADLAATAVANAQSRAELQSVSDEQAALRRVATLVARGVDQSEVFEAIVSEAGGLFGEETWLVRYKDEASAAIIAHHGASDELGLAGRTIPMDGSVALVARSGRPDRVDSYAGLTGPGADFARQVGIVACAAAPLIVQGTPWGALSLVSRGPALGSAIQDRLAQFADLAAITVANAQSRAELQLLADEQAALRRVAELVARGAATQQVFDQVTAEASRLLGDAPATLQRYERSGAEVVIVAQSRPEELGRSQPGFTVGARVPVAGETARARVWRTGRAARIDSYDGVAGREVLPVGIRANVSAPIHVEGRLWGVLSASSPGPPLPPGTEERLTRFCELVGAAIANAESRGALKASRARIVASADDARRRLARDVHDGAQQRLVHALLRLKQARAGLEDADGTTAKRLDESLVQVEAANAQLRELAHGILPAALVRGGLRAGVLSLLRHTPLPVDAEVDVGRLPELVETTAYFVIAEALTNMIKHASASRARVRAETVGDRLEVEISDDGRGGADPARGPGLTGLIDRVEAVGGTMSVTSPPGAGTTLSISLPIEEPDTREPPALLGSTSDPT